MKISLTIFIDPLRLKPEHTLRDAYLRIADAFADILNEEDMIEINAFDLSVNYDQDEPDVPSTATYDWLRRFNKRSKEQKKKP